MYNIFVNIQEVTNQNYIPLNELQILDENLFNEVKEYRSQFNEIITVDSFSIATIVETPALIKKRYITNVEIGKQLDIVAANNDYVIYIAVELLNGNNILNIKQDIVEKVISIYKKNKNDLTIISTYITNNIENLIKKEPPSDAREYPGLNKKHIKFLSRYVARGKYYNIKDYQSVNSTSYETARTSLEKLTKLKFFKKEKIGNKFTYKSLTVLKGCN